MTPDAIILKGRYAKMIKELSSSTEIRPKLFETMYDAYIFSAIYGLMKGRTATYNPEKDDLQDVEPATIRSEVLIGKRGKDSYFNIRKMVILMENVRGLSFEEKVDAALRFDMPIDDDADEFMKVHSKFNSNTELLNQFALGGLDLFYSKVVECDTTESLIYFMRETEEQLRKALSKAQ